LLGDQKAVDDLLGRHPELTVTIGDQYAAQRNWGRAIAIYSKAITARSGINHVRKLVALAGGGQDQDKPPLDVAARAKLRRQALDGLKAELIASTRLLEVGPTQDRPAIARTLRHWKQRSDLAGVREAEALAGLPADEQKAWQSLWADVDSLLKRFPTPEARETKRDLDKPETLARVHRRAHELALSNPGEAEPLFRQALEGYRKTQGPDAHLTLDLTLDLAGLLDQTGRGAEALPLFRDAIKLARGQLGPDDPRLAGILAPLGLSLVQQGKWTGAEAVLRECLAIREKAQPDDWSTFNTRSTLGGSLAGQKRYAEAEPLIVSGYEGLKAREARIPPPGKPRLREAAERVVKLYEAWGKPDKAAEWRARLAKPFDEANKPHR
jgi:hypothetical protein